MYKSSFKFKMQLCCLLHLALLLVAQLYAPGPHPFLGSIWLNKAFLSEKFSAMKLFVQQYIKGNKAQHSEYSQ